MRFWKRVDAQGNATTIESYSHDLSISGAIEITESEFDELLNDLKRDALPILQSRDLAKEFDDLVVLLKAKGILT